MSAATILALLPDAFDRWIDDQETLVENQGIRQLFGFQRDRSAPIPDSSVLADVLDSVDSRNLAQRQVHVRSDAFRIGILGAYDARCCVSNIGLAHKGNDEQVLYEVEAAHIIPVSKGGTDVIHNGLALNRSVHWAFDLGMVWVNTDMRVNVAREVQDDIRNEWIKGFEGRLIRLPTDKRLRPSIEALRWHADHVAIR